MVLIVTIVLKKLEEAVDRRRAAASFLFKHSWR